MFCTDASDTDALHATRLLAVEERPFQRVQRSLLGKDSLLRYIPRQQPTPPPQGDDAPETDFETEAARRQRFREEVLLDFAALESSILRIQLIYSSNQRERERYAAEKARILETAQAVRDNTVELRSLLEEAQKVLLLRKGYDELAGKILDDRKLKSREECSIEIVGLEKEIEELEQESADYETTWVGRREQFDKVVAEGEAMVRLIKGIKDTPEHGDGEEDENMEDDATRGENSRLGSPAPDGRTPRRADGGETPVPASIEDGERTSARPVNKFLDVDDATRLSSRAASPSRVTEEQAGPDVEMSEPTVTVDAAAPRTAVPGFTETDAQDATEPTEGLQETMDET